MERLGLPRSPRVRPPALPPARRSGSRSRQSRIGRSPDRKPRLTECETVVLTSVELGPRLNFGCSRSGRRGRSGSRSGCGHLSSASSCHLPFRFGRFVAAVLVFVFPKSLPAFSLGGLGYSYHSVHNSCVHVVLRKRTKAVTKEFCRTSLLICGERLQSIRPCGGEPSKPMEDSPPRESRAIHQREQVRAIGRGAKRGIFDSTGFLHSKVLPRGGAPMLDLAVGAARQQPLPVGRKSNCPNLPHL